MVAVKAREADRFVADPPAAVRLFLVYGRDQGAVVERAARIEDRAKARDAAGGHVVRLGSDELSVSPGRIAEEAYAASLFGGAPIIRLKVLDGRHNVMAAVEPLFERPPDEGMLIVEAGDLKPAAALRKAFEQASFAAAIACYEADPKEIAALAREILQEAGLAIEQPALDLLASVLGADRMATRNELEKLALYARSAGTVRVADVEAVVGESVNVRAEQVIDAALLGDAERVERDLARLGAEGQSASGLATLGVRQLIQLQALALERAGGRSAEAVVERARPPIFFKRKGDVATILERWPRADLARARGLLAAAILQARRQPVLEEAIMSAALQQVAAQGRRLSSRR